ncbi:MAG: FMN-binding protein [Microbacteriaceae bacterium]
MSARAVLSSIVASAAILVVGWQAGSAVTASHPAISQSPGNGSNGSTGATASGTYTGDSVGTRFGNVQVAITVSSGSLTDVTATHLTDADNRSVSISNRAAPVLRSEVLASQSARVSLVSGATYTSDAYLQSLQSALDRAGL